MATAAIGAGVSVVGGIMGGRKRKKAARRARAELAAQRAMFDPFVQFGQQAIAGGPITGETIEQQPGYQFRFRQGMQALERGFAARGGLLSGRAMKGAMRFGQGLAAQALGAERQYQMARGQFGLQALGMRGGLTTQIAQTRIAQGEAAAAPWDVMQQMGGAMFGANMPVGRGAPQFGQGMQAFGGWGGGMAGMT